MIDFKFEFKGFNNLEKKTKELSEYPKGSKLFINRFMEKNTNYKSFEELCNSSEFTIESQEDFQKITNSDDWDKYIKDNTNFNSWEEMMIEAYKEYVQRKLGLS